MRANKQLPSCPSVIIFIITTIIIFSVWLKLMRGFLFLVVDLQHFIEHINSQLHNNSHARAIHKIPLTLTYHPWGVGA